MAPESDLTPQPDGRKRPELWRGLEEWLDTPAFREMLHREFPDNATEWTDPVTRRRFLTLAGASLALAGVSGCKDQWIFGPKPAPSEKIYPYVHQPEQITLGNALHFATAIPTCGVALGVLVKSREGRPIKVEGNPDHPSSLGSTDILAQAEILNLYDPERSRDITYRGSPNSWEYAQAALRPAIERAHRGEALRVLTTTVTSPTLAAAIGDLLKGMPDARWVQYDAAGNDSAREGGKRAFGDYVNTVYDFKKADVVLSLDADFLSCGPGHVRYSRDYADRRRIRQATAHAQPGMNRLYAVECMLTNTGASADHRLPLKPTQIEQFARALAAKLGVAGAPAAAGDLPPLARQWVDLVAEDLGQHRGRCIVLAGDSQPASLHALAHAINSALGNFGQTVTFTNPIEAKPTNQLEELRTLAQEMRDGKVKTLFVFGGNPVYDAPADFDFAQALTKVPLRVHLGLYQDETAIRCDWHIPEAHFLETWGDARGHDGTVTVMQPLIAPLYKGRSAMELLATLTDRPETAGLEIVRTYWQKNPPQGAGPDFDAYWQKSLQLGKLEGTASPAKTVSLQGNWAATPPGENVARAATETGGMEIAIKPDPTIFDGRFANNAWLQELPKPITKLTWDNAAIMSPKTAAALGVTYSWGLYGGGEHGRVETDLVELKYRDRSVRAGAWIQPGHPDDAITVHLGYGREKAGEVGTNTGFNAYRLRFSDAPHLGSGLKVTKTGERFVLASTQLHFSMEERRPARRADLEKYHEVLAKAPDDREKKFFQLTPVAGTETRKIYSLVPGPGESFPSWQKADRHQDENAPPKGELEDSSRRTIPLTFYPDTSKTGHRWAMAIDLTVCTGCSACTIACVAENNISMVGKKEVTRGRAMHWIRVDRYYTIRGAKNADPEEQDQRLNDPANIETLFQPVPCQQCEKAPCELVCPVEATAHSADGLNDMIYNRCVGTRYCSNNCPYKVRRFNFLAYADFTTEAYKLGRNPEVTVRGRGVMEKCTYCVQRIRQVEIIAEREWETRPKDQYGRPIIRDGEIVTACQAACPARAIVFGDLADPTSEVYRWKEEITNYGLLAELNTMPRTTYLAAVRNPNPKMPKGVA